MDERVQFIADFLTSAFTMRDLCTRYNVSRPTGYKWVARYHADGPSGLRDRSRRPQASPHETPRELLDAVVALRRRHPDWGARKLIDRLRLQAPDRPWPAASTAGVWLQRAGLVTRRRRRPTPGVAVQCLTDMRTPNAVWTIDFKGHFRTHDGVWCYPLTLMDGCTRYLLACRRWRIRAVPRRERCSSARFGSTASRSGCAATMDRRSRRRVRWPVCRLWRSGGS